MSNLIEQAAQRLEQLRRAGATLPDVKPSQRLPGGGQTAAPAVESRRVDLNFEAMAAAGVLIPNGPRSLLGDQFRVIKRCLLYTSDAADE